MAQKRLDGETRREQQSNFNRRMVITTSPYARCGSCSPLLQILLGEPGQLRIEKCGRGRLADPSKK